MGENYKIMWEQLGLDLGAHDALLEVLGKSYQDIYLVQKNRPESMGYFDFLMPAFLMNEGDPSSGKDWRFKSSPGFLYYPLYLSRIQIFDKRIIYYRNHAF